MKFHHVLGLISFIGLSVACPNAHELGECAM
jgi:hypothetical protein